MSRNTNPTPAFNGRAARIVGWLTENPQGLQFGKLLALEASVRPETTRSQLSATLVQLIDQRRRVVRTGQPHHYIYRLSQKGAAAEPKAPKPKQYSSTLARAPKPESVPAIGRRKSASAQQQSSGSIVLGTTGSTRDLTAADLSADVAAFLARGGRIQKLAQGEVSKPFERLFRDDLQKPKTTRSHNRIAVAA